MKPIKADAWLNSDIDSGGKRVSRLYDDYAASVKLRTGKDNHLKTVSVGDNYIKPAIGHRKISALTEQMLQDIIDGAASKGVNGKPLSKKSHESKG